MSILEQEILLGSVSDNTILVAEQQLSEEDYLRYQTLVKGDQRNAVIAWLLWFFVGTLQLHMIYLDIFDSRHLKALRITSLVLAYFIIGGIIMVPLWIYDAIKMNSFIKESNNMKKAKILSIMFKNNKD